MKKRQYPYKPKTQRTETDFSKKWGILAHDLAKEEGTTCDAIHMRVRNYGNPFQRKRAPTLCEIMTGRTSIDLALELGITPVSVAKRIEDYGDPYYSSDAPTAIANRGKQRAEKHWTETHQAGVYKGSKEGWLHPRHPDYLTWRYKYIKKHCPVSNEHNMKETQDDC